jgi:hypothetical protein
VASIRQYDLTCIRVIGINPLYDGAGRYYQRANRPQFLVTRKDDPLINYFSTRLAEGDISAFRCAYVETVQSALLGDIAHKLVGYGSRDFVYVFCRKLVGLFAAHCLKDEDEAVCSRRKTFRPSLCRSPAPNREGSVLLTSQSPRYRTRWEVWDRRYGTQWLAVRSRRWTWFSASIPTRSMPTDGDDGNYPKSSRAHRTEDSCCSCV